MNWLIYVLRSYGWWLNLSVLCFHLYNLSNRNNCVSVLLYVFGEHKIQMHHWKNIIIHLSAWLIKFFSSCNCFHALPLGHAYKEPWGVRFGSCGSSHGFAAQSPGQLRLTAHPRVKGQSPGPDPRQPDSSSRQFAARFGPYSYLIYRTVSLEKVYSKKSIPLV